MIETDVEFVQLMARVREGSPEAIREMLERYGGHIRVIVRRQLHHRLRKQFDSMDFQQDVWASFFRADLQQYDFTCPEALCRYLSEIAYNKVVEVYRQRLGTAKYDLRRELSFEQLHIDKLSAEVMARNPSPSQLAIANEQWELLLKDQPPHHRRILEMLRQGHTHEEIAAELQCNAKMVQRLLHALKERGMLP